MTVAPGKRVLVCLRYGIGDVVMELPALRHLRAQSPDVHVTALGARPATELLEGDPVIDALACVQDFGFEHWGDRGGDAARRRAADWLAEQGFDCVLDRAHTVVGMRRVLSETGLPAHQRGGQRDLRRRRCRYARHSGECGQRVGPGAPGWPVMPQAPARDRGARGRRGVSVRARS